MIQSITDTNKYNPNYAGVAIKTTEEKLADDELNEARNQMNSGNVNPADPINLGFRTGHSDGDQNARLVPFNK